MEQAATADPMPEPTPDRAVREMSGAALVSAYAESIIDRHVEHRHGWIVDLDRERMLKTELLRRLAATEALEYAWAMEENLDNEVTFDDVGRARRNLRAALQRRQ